MSPPTSGMNVNQARNHLEAGSMQSFAWLKFKYVGNMFLQNICWLAKDNMVLCPWQQNCSHCYTLWAFGWVTALDQQLPGFWSTSVPWKGQFHSAYWPRQGTTPHPIFFEKGYRRTHPPYTLWQWRWKQHVPLKHQQHPPHPHNVRAQAQN